MSFFPEMSVSATGLAAERARLEVIAQNIANANTTKTANGTAFRRQLVELVSAPDMENEEGLTGVEVAGVVEDPSPLPQVYDPTHPDADAQGLVTRPNVNLMLEMVDMLSATRAYEANVTAIQSAKDMARTAMDI